LGIRETVVFYVAQKTVELLTQTEHDPALRPAPEDLTSWACVRRREENATWLYLGWTYWLTATWREEFIGLLEQST
jgi:hypothetical protein